MENLLKFTREYGNVQIPPGTDTEIYHPWVGGGGGGGGGVPITCHCKNKIAAFCGGYM